MLATLRRFLWKADTRARLQSLARRRPWDQRPPAGAVRAAGLMGMLGSQESLLFYYLARDFLSGRGTVVDAGSFLGKSAALLASGLRDNPVAPVTSGVVHCFDQFVARDGTVDYLRKCSGRDFQIGDSFRDLFEEQVSPHRGMLHVHEGDFLGMNWPGDPIEILLVDIAKSIELWRHVLDEMFTSLVPGESLVIHQDYHQVELPHIPVVMEFLHPYFELQIPCVDYSAVFLLREPIPRDVLQRAVAYDFTAEEECRLMDAAIARIAPKDRSYIMCASAVLRTRLTRDPETLQRTVRDLEGLLVGLDHVGHFTSGTLDEAGRGGDSPARKPARLVRQTQERIGWDLIQSGAWQQAFDLSRELATDGENESTLLMAGVAMNGLRRYREAEDYLRRVASGDGDVSQYAPAELARALLHQHRHDDAERLLLDRLALPDKPLRDKRAIAHYVATLREVFAARGNRDKDRKAVNALRQAHVSMAVVHALEGIPPTDS